MAFRQKWSLSLVCIFLTIAVILLLRQPSSEITIAKIRSRYRHRNVANEHSMELADKVADEHSMEFTGNGVNRNSIEFAKESIISSLQEIDKHSTDYLIYDCLASSGRCGGWNDRITGVVDTLMISLIIGKKFRLIINTPCDTKAYFAPNKWNWTVTSDILSRKGISKVKLVDEYIFKLDVKNIGSHFKSSVNFFRNNWDVIDVFRVTPYIKDKIPWICSMHHADIYKMIFEILFKPTKSVLEPISRLSLDKSKKLVCAHVRMGTNPLDKNHTFAGGQRFPFNRTTILFEFLKKYDTNSNYMYIASDSPMLKDKIQKTFPDRFVDIPGEIILVDIDRGKGACDAYAKGLSEWWILTMCDVLVLTKSGFGVMAAYFRDNDKPLYCMDTDKMEIVPCTRYNVLEHYTYEMHIPKYTPISRRNNITHDYCPPGGLQLNEKLPKPIQRLVAGKQMQFIGKNT